MHVLIKEWTLDWHRPESQSQLSLCSLYTSFWNLWISGGSAVYVEERPSELTVVKLGLIQWFSSNIGEFCDNNWIIVFFQGTKNQRLYFEILLQKKKKKRKNTHRWSHFWFICQFLGMRSWQLVLAESSMPASVLSIKCLTRSSEQPWREVLLLSPCNRRHVQAYWGSVACLRPHS